MKRQTLATVILTALTGVAAAHSWNAENAPIFDEATRAHILGEWQQEHGEKQSVTPQFAANGATVSLGKAPAQAAPFVAFAPKVKVKWDNDFLFIESNGMPSHNMMVGITNWQQQVPVPHEYVGDNAWRIPLHPVVAKQPASIKDRFMRGAIALAVNGVPIFNPQNNRGEVSQDIGELDQWGGHCGRADDYHYHAAPLHLQSTAGRGMPIAYALDGYPIFGLTEPDGSSVGMLDELHGHEAEGGYHYHASTKYPYVNGGFHGEVVERDGQVDPQPRAGSMRGAGAPLRGAIITGFERLADGKNHVLQYTLDGATAEIRYGSDGAGSWKFQYVSANGTTTEQTYREGQLPGGGGKGRPPRRDEAPPPRPSALHNDTPAVGTPKRTGRMVLRSPEIGADGILPIDYSGDGSGSTLPLQWTGAPAGTQSYALIMDHLDPEGAWKWYWTLYNIPANTTSLPKNVKGVGKLGTGFRGEIGYEPPHSKGPGAKTYTLTMYALSAAPQISVPASQVNREILLAAIKDRILDSAELKVTYSRSGNAGDAKDERKPPMRPAEANVPPPRNDRPGPPPARPAAKERKGKGKGGPDKSGIIKPSIADTIKVNVYADNWFILYINGKLTAVDSIDFIPHNVVTVDILPEYPMTIAVMAKDNADARTGMEYGDHIGDGGFILKFADGTVSNASWKAKSFFKGPLNHDVASPKVDHTPIPGDWFAVDFDDYLWANATEYTEERVNPKEPFYNADFADAKFIWTEDLDLDNTLIFRITIQKPGWTKRWNTKPDLDVRSAPHE